MTPFAIGDRLVLGAAIGVISSMLGIGGGVFLIPALIFFYGMSQKSNTCSMWCYVEAFAVLLVVLAIKLAAGR